MSGDTVRGQADGKDTLRLTVGHPGDGPPTEPLRRSTSPLPLAVDTVGDGRYELGDVLGAGGMGIVRRARDVALDRDVAVKLLADNLATDVVARERFLREARAAAGISDPHVVAVHDVGEHDGRPYLVMELVDGASLADDHAERPLSPDEVTSVARAALRALAAIHDAGVLHRDVKPANLLRASDGSVKLSDLGVAEAAGSPGLTRTGFVIGTGPYLAPERRRGCPATVATDLYALGATLDELLRGAPVPSGQARPASTRPPLDALLTALRQPDPAQRPPDARSALRLLSGEPAAQATGPTGGSGRAAALPWWTAAALTLVVALGFLAFAPSDDPPAQQPSDGVVDGVVEGAVDGGDPQGGDPAQRARDLADWLRDR